MNLTCVAFPPFHCSLDNRPAVQKKKNSLTGGKRKCLKSLEDEVDDLSKWQRHGVNPPTPLETRLYCGGVALTTQRRKRKHAAQPPPHPLTPAERRALMWTTTLLQVWDGAKWRKMISSQADRTLSHSSCSAVWSTARVTLSTQRRNQTLFPKHVGRGGKINHWANVIGQPSVTFPHRPHNT